MKREHINLLASVLTIGTFVGAVWLLIVKDRDPGIFQGISYLAVWVLVFLGVRLVNRRRRNAAFNWPTVSGTVQFCEDYTEQNGTYLLTYSYQVADEYHSSSIWVSRKLWADDPSRMLRGASIQVRVNPRDPLESVVEAASLPGMMTTAKHDLISCNL